MNRRLTNLIRFVMDECLPPLLRDNRYFMWPFFYLAYHGRQIAEVMEFKSRVLHFSTEQYRDFYAGLDSISRRRDTDLNRPCLDAIETVVDAEQPESVLDAGCGNGYLLSLLKRRNGQLKLSGADVVPPPSSFDFPHHQIELESLDSVVAPHDLVVCAHTLEHVRDLQKAMVVLRRLARRTLLIVVPCQRYYYFTLDEHLHFFPDRCSLVSQLGVAEPEIKACQKLAGDWLLVLGGTA
jgi:hypothetical protein